MTCLTLWDGVDRIIDRADSLDDLRAHGLHLLAARRWREIGREVPRDLVLQELMANYRAARAMTVLHAARDAYDGRMLLLKGPELASRYPDAALRPSNDLDILVDNGEQAQRALTDAGFEPVGARGDDYYDGLHHLRPLQLPDTGIVVEIHRRPNWVEWYYDAPRTDELMSVAVPSATGVPGLLALPAAHHALAVAAHSWGERPLRRILDLVDLAALAAESERAAIAAVAAAWNLTRIWQTMIAAADALFFAAPRPWSLRTWARELEQVRGCSVAEDHVQRFVSPFWALPPHRAVVAAMVAVGREITPAPSETWSNKFARARRAIAHPTRSKVEHRQAIGPEGIQPRFKRG